MKVIKTLNIAGKIATAFIGRVFARLRHLQRKAKLRVESIQLVIKDGKMVIYDDHRVVVEATKDYCGDWQVNLTEQYARLIPA